MTRLEDDSSSFHDRDQSLVREFRDPEYRHAFADAALGSQIALQIKANRQLRRWSQEELAEKAGMTQSQISRLEDEDYGSWSISSLRRIARAFDLALSVGFQSFPEMLSRDEGITLESLGRPGFDASRGGSEESTTTKTSGGRSSHSS